MAGRPIPDEVTQYLAGLARMSRPVLRLTKRAVDEALRQPPEEALACAERLYLGDLMRLDDAHEGLAAFLEKRPPVWKEA